MEFKPETLWLEQRIGHFETKRILYHGFFDMFDSHLQKLLDIGQFFLQNECF
jgi:hypothetical protein